MVGGVQIEHKSLQNQRVHSGKLRLSPISPVAGSTVRVIVKLLAAIRSASPLLGHAFSQFGDPGSDQPHSRVSGFRDEQAACCRRLWAARKPVAPWPNSLCCTSTLIRGPCAQRVFYFVWP